MVKKAAAQKPTKARLKPDGWDSSDDEREAKKDLKQASLASMFGGAVAPAARPASIASDDSDDCDVSDDGFDFGIPDNKAQKSGSGKAAPAPGLLPGWTVVKKTGGDGRTSKSYRGPNGKTAQTLQDMRAKARGGAGGKSSLAAADSSDEEAGLNAAPKKGTLDGWRAKPRLEKESKSAAQAGGKKPAQAGGGKKAVGGPSAKVGKAAAARPSAGKATAKGKAGGTSGNADSSDSEKGEDDDLLSRLLSAKRQRELDEKEADRQITDKVEQFYDNGVRINPELRRMFAPGAGTS